MPKSDVERIAVLESRATEVDRQRDVIFDKLDDHDERFQQVLDKLSKIERLLSGQQGFVRGAWFAVSALAGLIGALAMALWHKVTHG